MSRFSVTLTEAQQAFLNRKKKELARFPELVGKQSHISNSTMLQALITIWMKAEDDARRSKARDRTK